MYIIYTLNIDNNDFAFYFPLQTYDIRGMYRWNNLDETDRHRNVWSYSNVI